MIKMSTLEDACLQFLTVNAARRAKTITVEERAYVRLGDLLLDATSSDAEVICTLLRALDSVTPAA